MIICTTALCRPEIHNLVFPKIIKLLNTIYINIIWIINIDKTSIHTNQYYTKNNFINISKKIKNLNNIIIHTPNKPNFYNAVCNIISSIDNLDIDNYCLFWLEDDWILINDINFETIFQNYYSNNTYIPFIFKTPLGGFMPSIWGEYIVKTIINIFKTNININHNPETLCKYNLHQIYKHIEVYIFDVCLDLFDYKSIIKYRFISNDLKRDYKKYIISQSQNNYQLQNNCINKKYNIYICNNIKKNNNIKIIDICYTKNYMMDIGRYWSQYYNFDFQALLQNQINSY